jgi:hypothetical protein
MKAAHRALSRRAFLFAASTGAGVTAVALITGGSESQPVTPSENRRGPSARGYQLTEHVRNYYRTAMI